MRRLSYLATLFLASVTLSLAFQNCGKSFLAGNDAKTQNLSSTNAEQDNSNLSDNSKDVVKPLEQRLAEIQAKRLIDWRPKNPFWEVVYDGKDTPADNVPGAFMWDNPIDDDWSVTARQGSAFLMEQFRLNTMGENASPGFLTVDRTTGDPGKTGSIYRRDEWLDPRFSHANLGVTIEFRVKLLPSSQKDAFKLNFVTTECAVSIAFSGASDVSPVGAISSGSIYGGNTNHRALDTTSDFRVFRVIQAPQARKVEVYWLNYANEDDRKPATYAKIHEAECLTNYKIGSGHTRFPYIQIGDNSNNADENAGYILDFIRYRRDAIHPTVDLPPARSRSVPALPEQESTPFVATGGYEGGVPINNLDVISLMGAPANVQPQGRYLSIRGTGMPGVAEFNTGTDSHANVQVIHPRGLVDEGDVTIEARIKVLPNHGERGFRLTHLDTLGAVSLYISPDSVETALGTKPAGFQKFKMKTDDNFHIYRLVRKAGQMYAQLYVDNDPAPKIVDQHISAEIEAQGFDKNPIIYFGAYKIFPEAFKAPGRLTTGHLQIDYIRWNNTAFAPAPRP